MTEETTRNILRDYNDRDIPMRELEIKYGIERSKLARIAVEAGATPRRPGAYGKRLGIKAKLCPKCKKTIAVEGAKYCCYCGADIRSEKQIILERLDSALTMVMYLPESMREEMRDTILAACKELQR